MCAQGLGWYPAGLPSSGSGTSPWDKPSTVVTPGVLAHARCPQSVIGVVASTVLSMIGSFFGSWAACVQNWSK